MHSPKCTLEKRYRDFSSIVLSASTNVKSNPDKTVITAAASRDWLQPHRTAMYAVNVDEIAPPTLPNVFMSAESEAEKSGARSMHDAQKFVAANILKPAARAIKTRALDVTVR
jgi:hypothetical protein